MTITQATHLRWPNEGVAIILNGKLATIDLIKKSLLDLGLARLQNENGDEYPIKYHLPADCAQGRGALDLRGFTDDPVVVCLARRYWKAVNSDDYQPGPVPVPSVEEARAELADPNSWTMGI